GYPGPSLCVGKHAYSGPPVHRQNIILVVSTLEPRKNARFVIDWFHDTQLLQSDMQLWWVGAPAWWAPRDFLRGLRSRRQRTKRRRVKFVGAVSDRRLCELYQRAAFTIYPSLYEGFGFPVLDSLWHKTAVLSSFNSSLQEFAGPGVFYFDALDPASLDQAYRAMATAWPVPIDREALRERFSWDALARTVLGLCA